MSVFAQACESIRTAIETGQIGVPVAVRAVVHLGADPGQIEAVLGTALAEVATWLDRPLDSIMAQGDVSDGQVSTFARFGEGRMALVSAGLRGAGSPLMELLVFGNRGVLSWEPGSATGSDDAEVVGSPEADRLRQLLQQSLERGEPVGGDGSSRGRVRLQKLQHVNLTSPAAPRGPRKPPFGVLLVAGDYTHQPAYARDLAADPRCRLIGLADEAGMPPRRQALNEQFSKRMNIPLLPDLEAALQRPDVHIVSLCAEPYRRGPIAVAAARAGKHLYFDKPLAASLAAADDMVGAIRQAGVVGHMMTMVLNEPAQTARQIVNSGRLGELRAIHCDVSFAKGQAGTADLSQPRQETARPERYELADSKREMSNIGVYPLAMLHWLLGRRVNRVMAATGNFFFAEHQANDMEDFGQMLLEFDGGVTASVTAGRAGWRSHPGFGVHRVCLIGSKSTAVVDSSRPRVEVWADVAPFTTPDRDPDDPMGMWEALPDNAYQPRPKQSWIKAGNTNSDARYFIDCIEQGRASEIPADIGAASTEALLAAYHSAASGQLVELVPHSAPACC